MIRKALVAVCLLLALATFVIGACSYRKEIVCRGREEGVTADGNSPISTAELNLFPNMLLACSGRKRPKEFHHGLRG